MFVLTTDWIGQAIVPIVISLIALFSGLVTRMLTNRRLARARELAEAVRLKKHEEDEIKDLAHIERKHQDKRIDEQSIQLNDLSKLMAQVTVALGGQKSGPFTSETIGIVAIVASLAQSTADMQKVMATKKDLADVESNLTLLINRKGGQAS